LSSSSSTGPMGGGESHWQALTMRSASSAVTTRKLRSDERVEVKTVIPETMGEQWAPKTPGMIRKRLRQKPTERKVDSDGALTV
jgi:hypothetical protein